MLGAAVLAAFLASADLGGILKAQGQIVGNRICEDTDGNGKLDKCTSSDGTVCFDRNEDGLTEECHFPLKGSPGQERICVDDDKPEDGNLDHCTYPGGLIWYEKDGDGKVDDERVDSRGTVCTFPDNGPISCTFADGMVCRDTNAPAF